MQSKDLVYDFFKKSKNNKKWLTVKQVEFLRKLTISEDFRAIKNFDDYYWDIGNYVGRLTIPAPNGCRQITFTRKSKL